MDVVVTYPRGQDAQEGSRSAVVVEHLVLVKIRGIQIAVRAELDFGVSETTESSGNQFAEYLTAGAVDPNDMARGRGEILRNEQCSFGAERER
jgi:hypothetical protein